MPARSQPHLQQQAAVMRLSGDAVFDVVGFLELPVIAAFGATCRRLNEHLRAPSLWRRIMVTRRLIKDPDAPRSATGDDGEPLLSEDLAARLLMRLLCAPKSQDKAWNPVPAPSFTLPNFIRLAMRGPVTVSPGSAQGGFSQSRRVDPMAPDMATDRHNDAETSDEPSEIVWPPRRELTMRDACLMLNYVTSASRATPQNVTARLPLLRQAETTPREGADVVTLGDGHSVLLKSGFCDDPVSWVFSYEAVATRVWLPEIVCRHRAEFTTPLTDHDAVTYGHKLSLLNRTTNDVVQYGGLTMGGYRGASAELQIVNAVPDKPAKLTDLDRGRIEMMPETARHDYITRTIKFGLSSVPRFPARGYHAQAIDRRRGKLYLFGGLLEGGVVDNHMLVIDIASLEAKVAEARAIVVHGYAANRDRCIDLRDNAWRSFVDAPAAGLDRDAMTIAEEAEADEGIGGAFCLPTVRPRFGHSMTLVDGQLYIAGGYTGRGMFRLFDGDDLTDIHRYDPATGVCREIVPRANAIPGFLGRCHTATPVGPFIAFFGGTSRYSRRLVMFDTRDNTLRKHADGIDVPDADLRGRTRTMRLSNDIVRVAHCAALSGSLLVILGGCSHDLSIMSDFGIDLFPPPHLAKSSLTVAPITDYLGPSRDPTEDGGGDDEDTPAAAENAFAWLTALASGQPLDDGGEALLEDEEEEAEAEEEEDNEEEEEETDAASTGASDDSEEEALTQSRPSDVALAAATPPQPPAEPDATPRRTAEPGTHDAAEEGRS